MKNTFVVIMSIAVFSFSLLTWEVLADDIKGIDQVKTCLAMVYLGQMDFHKKNQRYAKNIKELDLEKGPSYQCNRIELDFSKVENAGFTVLATSGSLSWSVDQQKNIIQLR